MTDAIKGILGHKLGMTQVFDANNRVVPVSVVAAGPVLLHPAEGVLVAGVDAGCAGDREQHDERVRQVLAYGIDRDALVDTVGNGAPAAHNFTLDGSTWSTDKGAIPGYDPEKAQELVDSYVAEHGAPLVIDMLAA